MMIIGYPKLLLNSHYNDITSEINGTMEVILPVGLGWETQEWSYALLAQVLMGTVSWMETRKLG